tara:strand:- start:2525 stop:2818 length:294 start_codon:yes stop_codon:yes gene_type:complete
VLAFVADVDAPDALVAAAAAELAAAVASAETPDALAAEAVADVAAEDAELAAFDALTADSLALLVAMTACAVTAVNVASVLESPAPPSPLKIAMNSS